MSDYEVELKFPLRAGDDVEERLAALGAVAAADEVQSDRYFAHPVRDFSQTDEALRLRSTPRSNSLTYKGPLLDDATKTRQELELDVAAGPDAAHVAWAILRAVGFEDVRCVVKRRRPWRLTWEGRPFDVALDDVEGLGRFLEIETMAGAADWTAARDSALRLAARLELHPSERRSYLQLLLEQDQSTAAVGSSGADGV